MNLKRKQFTWLILSAAVILTAAPLVFSQDTPEQDETARQEMRAKFKAKMEERIKEIHKELGLSPEQQQKLDAHREQQSEDREEFFSQMRAKRKELAGELQNPELNMDRINAIHTEIKAMMNQKADKKLEHILYVRQVLTPEQFSKFMGLMEKHKNRWREKGGEGWPKENPEEGPGPEGPGLE